MAAQPRRSELISVIRLAESELREAGSIWWDDAPGWIRKIILDVANDLLRELLRIDQTRP